MGLGRWVVGIVVVGGFAAIFSSTPRQETKRADPAEAARKAKDDAEWVRQVLAVRQLRQGLKNPGSFRLETAIKMPDGHLCVFYRATNSFNAIVPGHAVISATAIQTSVAAWNQFCGGRKGTDLTYIRNAI